MPRPRPRSLTDKIIKLTVAHPALSSRGIARIAECLPEYVRTVWKRKQLRRK